MNQKVMKKIGMIKIEDKRKGWMKWNTSKRKLMILMKIKLRIKEEQTNKMNKENLLIMKSFILRLKLILKMSNNLKKNQVTRSRKKQNKISYKKRTKMIKLLKS